MAVKKAAPTKVKTGAKKTSAVKKASVRTASAKVKAPKKMDKGQSLKCEVCGLVVTVNEVCGCVDVCDIICCGEQMKAA